MNEFFDFYPDGAGIEYFKLEEFYSEELIKELENQGIRVKKDKLVAITRNYGEDRIVWLEMGTSDMGLIHIIGRHLRDFEIALDCSDHIDIANLIITTITNNEIIDVFSGGDPLSKNLVYVYRAGGYYLYVVVDGDGYILTAYPSRG